MKAILNIIDVETEEIPMFEYDNLTMDTHLPYSAKPDPEHPNMVQYEPTGKSITLITSNMPTELKDELTGIIKEYCNPK